MYVWHVILDLNRIFGVVSTRILDLLQLQLIFESVNCMNVGCLVSSHHGLLGSLSLDHKHMFFLLLLEVLLMQFLLVCLQLLVDCSRGVKELWEPANAVVAAHFSWAVQSTSSIFKLDGLPLVDSAISTPEKLKLSLVMYVKLCHLLVEELLVNCDLEDVVDQVDHEVFVDRLQNRSHVRTGVDFDQPNSEVLIKNEVKANELKLLAQALVGVNLVDSSQVRINHQVLDPFHDVILVEIWILDSELLQVLQKVVVRQLVSIFELLVLFGVDLETIVGQVDVLGRAVERILVRARSQVAWLVQPQILFVIDQSKHTDVELATVV